MRDALLLDRFRFAARTVNGYVRNFGRRGAEVPILDLLAAEGLLCEETRAAIWTAFGDPFVRNPANRSHGSVSIPLQSILDPGSVAFAGPGSPPTWDQR